jgi:hypothetical protein
MAMALTIGIVFFLASAFGLYWTGKRAFHRRNAAGVQEFNSFGGALATNALEGIIKIASWIGIVFGAGTILLSFVIGR